MAISSTSLEKLVNTAILESLAPFKFVMDETGGAFCDQGDHYLYIGAVTIRHAGRNRIEPFGQVGFESVNRIKITLLEPGHPIGKRTGTFQVNYRHFAQERDAYIGCETEEELPLALARVRDLTLDRILPCLQKYSDPVEVLNAYFAHDEHEKNSLGTIGATNYSSALSGLILARLFRPEQYEVLKRRYGFFFEPLIPDIKVKALRLIAYLDCDPLPAL